MKKIRNWARTTLCRPKDIFYPETEEEIVDIVKICNANRTPLKVVGKAHSYNDIFCAGEEGVVVSLKKFDCIEHIDHEKKRVTVQAGIDIPKLIKKLKPHGLSLKNLGTNIFDNIAGACSTGYHGSGMDFGIFSTDLIEMEVITPTGEKRRISRDDEAFKAYGTGLGMLGIIIRVTLQCEPFYKLEVVEKRMKLEEIEAQFSTLLKEHRHFKFVWIPHTDHFMVWLADKTDKPESSFLKKLYTYGFIGVVVNNFLHEALLFFASFNRKLVPKINRFMSHILLPAEGEEARSVYASHWAFFLPHVLKQDVVEYAFSIEETFDVFREIIKMIETKKINVDTPIEVRFVKKDDFWMSPTQGEDVCFIGTKIHFPLMRRPEYFRYFSLIDQILLKHRGRPHWGKQFRITTEDFRRNYPHWDKFWAFADKEDPNQIFRNRFSKKLRGE